MKLLFIEPLEVRIAPATLINPTTVTFHDLDGDDVTVKFTKPIFTDLNTANLLLKFDTGDIASMAANDSPQQLQLIDLSGQTATASGVGITVTAKHNPMRGGDGFADVGYINATGIDLGAVSIAGDLGRMNAGAPGGTGAAIKSLTVQSMGALGTSTQAAGGTLASTFDGGLPSLIVKGHLRDVSLTTLGGVTSKLGTLTVGGSDFGANISSAGDIATLKIGGSLLGGTAVSTGRITTAGNIGSITIGQSIVGTLDDTAVISAGGNITTVKVGFDVRGGAGTNSGRIETTGAVGDGTIATANIGGSIVGGGNNSGALFSVGRLSTVTVGGDVRGGAGVDSGEIGSDSDAIGSVVVKGSLIGSAKDDTGRITADRGIGAVVIGGSVLGGSGLESGTIEGSDDSGTVTIMGSLVGYVGTVGGKGEDGAKISADSFKSITIGGSIFGGTGDNSGQISSTFDGISGSISVGGSIVGGAGETSGSIQVATIAGSMKVGGDLRGGAGFGSGSIAAQDDVIGSVTIGGSVLAGGNDLAGSITAYQGLKSVTVKGSLIGTAAHKVIIASQYDSFVARPDFPTINVVNIGGRVEYTEILAGYVGTTPSNADAKIGSITVGGDWIASSIAAGVQRGPNNMGDGNFGTADDTLNPLNLPPTDPTHPEYDMSRIGSVTIKGQALGTPDSVSSTDNFGIVAESIGSIKIGTVSVKLTNGVDALALGSTGDFIAREDVDPGQVANVPAYAGGNTINHPTPTTYTYTDVDGDLVTITTTKPNVLVDADFIRVDAGSGIQVQEIRLANHASAANNGLGLTVSAKPQSIPVTVGTTTTTYLHGDGSVNIGFLNATGLDLGAVKIAGDLGRIEAGDSVLTTGSVKSLSVQSMGVFGTSTQAAGASLHSHLKGAVPSISVRGDMLDAVLEITGTSGGAGVAFDNGDLGALTIGGSLRAGADVANDVEGAVIVTGKIGSLTIGHDVIGGVGDSSGRISARNTIGAVKLGGFLQGGLDATTGDGSGAIVSNVGIKSATIGGDIRGGTQDDSGVLDGSASLGAVTIKGSLIGGGGEDAGSVLAEAGGKITSVAITGDVRGGAGTESGYIHSGITLGAVTIGGSLLGGDGPESATIYAGASVAQPHKIASVTIGGDVRGGVGSNSASIGSANGQVGNTVNIDISSITIKGSLVGGVGPNSGAITANNIPKLMIGGSFLGGSASGSGQILATGLLGSATISGSVEGGTANSTAYLSAQSIGTLSIKRDFRGGGGMNSGYVFANLAGAKTITIGGSMTSGKDTNAGVIDINGPLGSLTINGSVFGSAANHATIQARGKDMLTSPLALGKLTINGSADFLDVFGGRYDASTTVTLNAEANLGTITVAGQWTAGNITAGVNPGTGGQFGDDNDVATQLGANSNPTFHAKIASIVIKGRALGTVGGSDHFGFSSEEIGAINIGAVKIPLLSGAGNDNGNRADAVLLNLGPTGDFTAHEVPMVL